MVMNLKNVMLRMWRESNDGICYKILLVARSFYLALFRSLSKIKWAVHLSKIYQNQSFVMFRPHTIQTPHISNAYLDCFASSAILTGFGVCLLSFVALYVKFYGRVRSCNSTDRKITHENANRSQMFYESGFS